MDRMNEGFHPERTLPNPPPLPVALTTYSYKSRKSPHCSFSTATKHTWDSLFDEGYRADVSIYTDNGGIIYAHASILSMASPVFKSMLNLKQSRAHSRSGHRRSISIRGVPPEAVQIFIRFLYSSCFEEDKMQKHALSVLVLSHAYAIPHLKRKCECQLLDKGLITRDNVVDIFQLALLCDAPRLSLFCHRFMLKHFKAISGTDGWDAMKKSHPVLEKQILKSVIDEDIRDKERVRKINERKVYMQLYEAMEALVHICKDGCQTIGPYDKILKKDQLPCKYSACKGLELVIRHFAGCEMRVGGGCKHCKRMWQVLELHSRLCANSDVCGVPLCRNFKLRRRRQNKKDEIKWRILVRNIVRSKSISGAPLFSLGIKD
ncbi:BTB/POZ and TAZ domain-containing protein 4-like isoform X1 [Lycium ferocissimum]|uniref:BTB/POZ and TAZ domain-containing protein 4-like isoform X1 n=1 Tax=Lycium ferocissimum TaxID=112874 RepID=UPI002815BC1F|nr:BTB/POZ and TAZ domain-containing protein 4-like isoform X1 [Lycium ferocissimum]XP_059282700.1 BTB/POZ and TAZ domain-containing protein 4-like isoform X1 [Lycium ferocissimum]